MNDTSNTSEKLEINYAANAALIMALLLLVFVAMIDFNSLTASLIALTLAILYIGLQIGRVASNIR
jgi:hypothetical protein